ncbi:hypothetical protein TRFO_34744 [Tritrichomonas foetus]|uniref:Uncharacterized protein n=1 Tax=Tritrichomonas foetus TaxID=1144522 RepID=A0A1J4JIE5_9EUKA|nr:hypothetical protein TRFO_34744 [Tritrichomonas foetus]|eukprot:OHS98910.1 hypothetical protein TRFO_34744 [Tritrichomonas foetus]
MKTSKIDILKFSEYSSSGISHLEKPLTKKVYSLYEKNLKFIRGTFLMKMIINEPDSDFFDIPTVPSIFQSVYQDSSSVLHKFPPMYIQNFTQKIQNIYSTPVSFAASLDLYFQEDIADYLLFSYSTFPALFSFFQTDEFCESASSFLSSFFKCTKNFLISESLLTSFFISSTVFYDHFWSVLGDRIFSISYSTCSFDMFFNIFLDCLKSCLLLMSKYHIYAFKSFISVFPKDGHSFFIKRVILQPFLTASESSTSFISKEGNKFFQSFLEKFISLPFDSKYSTQLTDTLINQSTFASILPSVSGFIWKNGVPLLFSQFDIKLLHNILNFTEIFRFRYEERRVKFSDSFEEVISFSVFPMFCGKIPPEIGIGSDLFGEAPPILNIEVNDDDNRKWRQFLKHVTDENMPITHIIKILFNPPIEYSFIIGKNEIYIKFLLDYFHTNFLSFERAVLMQETLQKLVNMNSYIQASTNRIFHHFSFSFLQKNITNLYDIEPATFLITKDIEVPFVVHFEITMSALDTIKVLRNKLISKAEDEFEYELTGFMENEWKNYKNEPLFLYRVRHIMNASSILAHIKDCSYGKRLRIILKFVNQLKTILSIENMPLWKVLFQYAVFMSSQREVFSTFLYLHHFVFMSLKLDRLWDNETQNEWSLFNAGIWAIIQNNIKMNLFYSSKENAEHIFLHE